MKKPLLILVTLCLLTFPFNTVWAESPENVLKQIESDINSSDSFVNYMSVDDDASLESIDYRLSQVQSHFDESSKFYQKAADEESDFTTKTDLEGLSVESKALSDGVASMRRAFNSGDEGDLDAAYSSYDEAIDRYNIHVAAMNDNYELVDYSWLSYLFWVSLAVSVVLFFISRGNPILPAEKLRNKYEFELFKNSLWATIGSGITYFWYEATPAGGSFMLLWGPIVFGYIYFFKNLYTYASQHRPEINAAKKAQQEEVHRVLTSASNEAEAPEKSSKRSKGEDRELVAWDTIKD